MTINQKQLKGYYLARNEGTSFNDEYNMAKFSITRIEFNAIHSAIRLAYGMFQPNSVSLNTVNEHLTHVSI